MQGKNMTFTGGNTYIISVDGKPLYFCDDLEKAQTFCKEKILYPILVSESLSNPMYNYYIEMYDNVIALSYSRDIYFFTYNRCKVKTEITLVSKLQDSSS